MNFPALFLACMRRVSPVLGVAAALGGDGVSAQSVDDFYRGRQLTIEVGGTAGSGNDIYTRIMAKYISRHAPGSPTLVIQNIPSAIVALNRLYNVSGKDGLTIGVTQNTVPLEPLFGNKEAQFDPTKFNWLGTPSNEVALTVVWHTVPVSSIEEAKTRELIFGASSPSSTPAFYARLLSHVLGLRIRLITGYTGQADSFLAMERGENEGYASTFWSTLKSERSDWLRDKKLKLLLQFGEAPHPELRGVPFANDLISNPEDQLLMRVATAPLALGRPFVAPPGIPQERVQALRRALRDTFADPDFLVDCARQRLECGSPSSGEDMARIIAEAFAAPEPLRKRLQDIARAAN